MLYESKAYFIPFDASVRALNGYVGHLHLDADRARENSNVMFHQRLLYDRSYADIVNSTGIEGWEAYRVVDNNTSASTSWFLTIKDANEAADRLMLRDDTCYKQRHIEKAFVHC